MATEVSRLLVLGPDQDSNVAVTSKLQVLSTASSTYSLQDIPVLNIRTKYYRAPVQLHLHLVRDNTPEPVLQHELHDYEAVMCVVDANNHDSFLNLDRFAQRLVDIVPYEVCLLVTSTSTGPTSTENIKQMVKWCEDTGFEFIDLNPVKVSNEDNVINEKQGIERVLEALQCNMWRSMEMNSAKEKNSTLPALDEVSASTAEKRLDSSKSSEQVDAADDGQCHALLQALKLDGKVSSYENDDVDMAQFSAMIAEVRNVRDECKSLSDEKRRERATEVAMKLWSYLGTDDENSDSEQTASGQNKV
ncbi:Uncharacterized conserved protein [Plasmopara halstedii]|uniref:Uncharacterized conserved protein n=1 Tax=Plasmopara halstedii TaxID=4781 RepID=A0A0P1A751_PLAHL|nr:Uncharacterized conserved protein [Plasmopara halstedii]CEG36229.1 Uncharacterized conserved protein [Plasmopara halstedii]|eukprot:XP_024572598.1 Uncharacterized conserved protein [Plasmopara halstedii]